MNKDTIKSQIRIREAAEPDVAFIFNSWLKCYRSSKNTDGIQSPVYFAAQHKVIEGLLKSCQTIVACNPQDPNQIYGYITHELQDGLPVVHFIYIKEAYRNMHLAVTLMEEAKIDLTKPFFYTHRTLASDKYHNKFTMVYHPYLAYYGYINAEVLNNDASEEDSE